MQALSPNTKILCYTPDVQTGRPPKTKRTAFGERLFQAREEKGLSLREVAEALGVPLQTYGNWERRNVGIRPDHLAKLAQVLNVTLEHLLDCKQTAKKQSGPTGKLRRLFDEIGDLPKHQQQRVVATLEDALVAQKVKKAS